jgi:phosphatidylglycerophosphatase A
MVRKIAVIIATCFGAGYSPVAPGTAGAVVGLLPVLILSGWPWIYGLVAALLFFVGVWASGVAEEAFGRHDSPRIVVDEAASIMITFMGLSLTPMTLFVGFILNRLLDIVKPFPAYGAQRARAGWGIMLDDLVAGIYSNVILRIALAVVVWFE